MTPVDEQTPSWKVLTLWCEFPSNHGPSLRRRAVFMRHLWDMVTNHWGLCKGRKKALQPLGEVIVSPLGNVLEFPLERKEELCLPKAAPPLSHFLSSWASIVKETLVSTGFLLWAWGGEKGTTWLLCFLNWPRNGTRGNRERGTQTSVPGLWAGAGQG